MVEGIGMGGGLPDYRHRQLYKRWGEGGWGMVITGTSLSMYALPLQLDELITRQLPGRPSLSSNGSRPHIWRSFGSHRAGLLCLAHLDARKPAPGI